MTVEEWLRDTSVEPPCGPNLEYDDQFMALASSATGKQEQQYGDMIIPAEDPDWEAIVEQSTQLLGRSKDLRIVVLLTRGLTHVRGLAGFSQGLELSRRLLEQHWEEVHPRLAYAGEVDPYFRSNVLAALADPKGGGLIRDLRAATLFVSAAGPVTVRAAEATLKREATSQGAMTEAQLKQAAQANTKIDGAPILAIAVALDHCSAIASLTAERMGNADAPDLTPLTGVLKTIQRLLPVPGNESPGSEAASEPDAPDLTASAVVEGELRTRQDALRVLDSVCRFLERHEPSNPAPLFIRRAQRLIGSGFLDIMRDMAPDSLGHIELITGQRGSEPSPKDEGLQ